MIQNKMSWKTRFLVTTVALLILYLNYNLVFPRRAYGGYLVLTTTTTTTPTPPEVLLKQKSPVTNNVTIEKYDALKVHAKNLKARLLKKIQRLSKFATRGNYKHHNVSNDDVHMFFASDMKKLLPPNRRVVHRRNASDVSLDREIVLENFKFANSLGCGVVIVEYPYQPIYDYVNSGELILKNMFNLAPKYNLKITIMIKNYFKRSIMTIRKNISQFLMTYNNHPSLYRYRRKSIMKPVIYVMDSYTLPSFKWKDLLSETGIISIRNSPVDAIILGHLRDEEHSFHIRKSKFDGFFSCCNVNGEYFGNTWKNWQPLSIWADSHDLLSSIGIVEGSESSMSVKTALNTLLRCRPRPNFITFGNIQYREESLSLANEWNVIWSNNSNVKEHLLL